MSAVTPAVTAREPRRRDAAGTRQRLLEAAREQFSRGEYSATTVRDITDQAGVNVALVSRYFGSKEGLYRACLLSASSELDDSLPTGTTLGELPAAIAAALAGVGSAHQRARLLLLLRPSPDEAAESIRLDVLRSFAERLAGYAGWYPAHPVAEQLLLRAQLVLAAALGVAMLRSTTAVQPLAAASERELVEPLAALLSALLGAP